jgi:hypothetical protein
VEEVGDGRGREEGWREEMVVVVEGGGGLLLVLVLVLGGPVGRWLV